MELKAGDSAPDFSAPDQNGKEHKLSDYGGEWLLLYFYPRDNTPGCTREACSFRDNFEKFKGKLTIVGISGDSVKSHKNFSDKYSLPFTILADPEKKILDAYGANNIIFAKRASFLIDPKGKIAKVYPRVSPDTHAEQILKDLKTLQ